MCSQKVSDAVQPAGMLIVCWIESVWVVPYPSIQASHVPPCAGSLGPFWPITPAVADQETLPDSKPGLANFWPGEEQPPPDGLICQVNDVVAVWLAESCTVAVTE